MKKKISALPRRSLRLCGYSQSEMPELKSVLIDWFSQWEIHGFNFHDGYVHLDLPKAIIPEWKQLKLTPGPGFGDFSHPTTQIVVSMLSNDVIGQHVIDIGTGSGILALCAVALGADHVYAIDIDKESLKHAQENAVLNGMQDRLSFYLPENFLLPSHVENPLILMNMIMSEQLIAWNSLPSLHHNHGMCITSGILSEHKSDYISLVNQWGWKLREEQKDQEWLGLRFIKSSNL